MQPSSHGVSIASRSPVSRCTRCRESLLLLMRQTAALTRRCTSARLSRSCSTQAAHPPRRRLVRMPPPTARVGALLCPPSFSRGVNSHAHRTVVPIPGVSPAVQACLDAWPAMSGGSGRAPSAVQSYHSAASLPAPASDGSGGSGWQHGDRSDRSWQQPGLRAFHVLNAPYGGLRHDSADREGGQAGTGELRRRRGSRSVRAARLLHPSDFVWPKSRILVYNCSSKSVRVRKAKAQTCLRIPWTSIIEMFRAMLACL